jgi:hypothetical protein
MAAPTVPTLTAGTFGQPTTIAIGSLAITIYSGATSITSAGTSVGLFVAENITVNRSTNLIKRPNVIGGPNGVAMVDSYVEGSATLTMDSTANTQKIPATGNWFCLALDPSAGSTYECFVIHSVGQPFSFGEYVKISVSFIKVVPAS